MLTLALVLVVLAGVGLTVAFWPRAHDAVAGGACTGSLRVPVVAAPAIAPAVSTVVTAWNREAPSVGGTCIVASVTSQDSAAAEQALVNSTAATIWIPESAVWVTRLIADVPSLAPEVLAIEPVATSPLVVAAPPGRAAPLAAAARSGWAALLGGTTPVAIPDPTVSGEGALALGSYADSLGSSHAASTALAGASVRLAGNALPSAAQGFTNLQTRPGSAPAFIASEQDVIRANVGKPAPIAKAVYAATGGPTLDFPLVSITPATDPSFVTAAHALGEQLRSASGRRALAALGVRDPDGRPLDGAASLAGIAGAAGSARALAPRPATSAGTLSRVMRVWTAARRPTALLAVIDVSGSMREAAGNGRTKIQLASDAAATAMSLVPDSWTVGLWSFSSKPAPTKDWTQLVPLGSAKAQRGALVAAAHALPGGVGGDTALYATTLAAFQDVTAHYAPDKVDSIVLMTDGSNVDPGGIGLPALLSALKHGFNADRPVSITTIALGADADVAALRQISAATGGTTYVVRNPQDIRTVLLQTVLRRS